MDLKTKKAIRLLEEKGYSIYSAEEVESLKQYWQEHGKLILMKKIILAQSPEEKEHFDKKIAISGN